MLLKPQRPAFTFGQEALRFSFHENGSLMSVTAGEDLVNSMITTRLEGSADGIFLRIFRQDGHADLFPLTGRQWKGRLFRCDRALRYVTEAPSFTAEVIFLPVAREGWLRVVRLEGDIPRADLTCLQDLGLAAVPTQRTNELYSAQYLAHHALAGENGTVIVSRQNMPQGDRHPCVWQGMLRGRVASYATDVLDCPVTASDQLPDTVRQGEEARIALRSAPFAVSGTGCFAFYARYETDHPDIIRPDERPDLTAFRQALADLEREEPDWTETVYVPSGLAGVRDGAIPSEEEIAARYPVRELEERDESGRLLSFFLPDHRHVVTCLKERLCVRPHASVLMNLPDEERLSDNILSSTVYMRGNFACQAVVGNTSFHKLTGVNRGLSDLTPMSGTRILLREGDVWRPLGIPSLFEMDLHTVRWLYLTEDDELEVRALVMADDPQLRLTFRSLKGRRYGIALTMQLVLGDQEHNQTVEMRQTDDGILLKPGPDAFCRYPELCWRLIPDRVCSLRHDGLFLADGRDTDETLLCLQPGPTDAFTLDILGNQYRVPEPCACPDEAAQKARFAAVRDHYLNRLDSRSLPLSPTDEARLRHTAPWFLHNALIHFASPHGLEQTGGAAWGTRDVCQGPFELFLATGHERLAGDVLLAVFGHQQADGEWPQWFMFDRYEEIHAGDCHGDVILWPLKCLGDYLKQTRDGSILDRETGWLENARERCPLRVHLRQALDHLEGRFIDGTDLLSYAGGDWDDTLQPATEAMKKRTVSTWTQALAYQVTGTLAEALSCCGVASAADTAAELERLRARLKAGYDRLVIGGVPAGFCLLDENGALTPLLHPEDTVTGIHYRLLSLTRGILAGLTGPEQTEKQLKLIRENLRAPDGVHLLSRPTRYTGGNCRIFRRAEQAANIGREIGLQYCHAHIRYVQTLAAAGKSDEAWQELTRLLPPLLDRTVPNACPRQSNMYFSSSDALLPDRAAFEAGYARVLRGEVPVQGGWRLYSSGPGIFLACLLRDLLPPEVR